MRYNKHPETAVKKGMVIYNFKGAPWRIKRATGRGAPLLMSSWSTVYADGSLVIMDINLHKNINLFTFYMIYINTINFSRIPI